MARLVIQPGSPAAWEIQLKAGTNTIGRNPGNDFLIEDDSVSGNHCQIVVENGGAVIRDLDSTNGTYVNGDRVKEAALQGGQTVHLGVLELRFDAEAPGAGLRIPAGDVPLPQVAGPPRAVRIGGAVPVALATPPVPTGSSQHAAMAASPVVALPAAGRGSGPCKYHPKTPGRFTCGHCRLFYCELCVTTRGPQKFCRACGNECMPVQVEIKRPTAPRGGFYARLPGVFGYPFRGSGVLVLIFGTILLAVLRIGGGIVVFGIAGMVGGLISLGYLLTYMQCIIHSTAAGEEEMPPLPGLTNIWDDIVLPCLQMIGLILISFGPAIGVRLWVVATQQESMGPLVVAVFALGYFYFPMAFLAMAMLDSVVAANPLLVMPSIFKVPLEYTVALIVLAGVLGIRELGDGVLLRLFPRGLGTHSISKLLAMFGAQAFWSLVSLYLLTVGMRILGLLYLTKKEQLGWYNR